MDTDGPENRYKKTPPAVDSERLSIRELLDDEVAFFDIPLVRGLSWSREALGFTGMYTWYNSAVLIR
jgi:hypothetical protein